MLPGKLFVSILRALDIEGTRLHAFLKAQHARVPSQVEILQVIPNSSTPYTRRSGQAV